MAIVTNKWQDVFSRSYQQVKSNLIQKMKNRLPEVTDYSEGNLFIILISMFAGIAEVIHYYMDNMARETFFVTARRYSSLIKHTKLIDYHIKAAIPSTTDLLFYIGESGEISSKTYVIPINTEVTSENGLVFRTVKQKTLYEGTYGVLVPVEQKVYRPATNIGIITDVNSVIYIDETNGFYVEGSSMLTINDELWTLVDTFGYSKSNSKHYMVELDDSQKPFIKFGDGSYGSKPPLNGNVTLGYYYTKGVEGNVGENTITNLNTKLDIPNIKVTNPNPSTGGSNYEDFEMLKDHVPLSIRTLGMAITKQDYEDVAKLAPGVDKAYVDYKCGKFVDIYIVPDGGGLASESLRNNTKDYLSNKKIITTNIEVYATGSSYIYIDLTVTGRPSIKSTLISEGVIKALIDRYNFNTSEINKTIRLSDIYSLLDNLEMVDYLTINDIYVKPYPKPDEGVNQELNLSILKIDNVIDVIKYSITYQGDGIFELVSDYFESDLVNLGSLTRITSDDGSSNFSILIDNPISGNYTEGDRWYITLVPNDRDQKIQDFSIPRITKDTISLNIIETV